MGPNHFNLNSNHLNLHTHIVSKLHNLECPSNITHHSHNSTLLILQYLVPVLSLTIICKQVEPQSLGLAHVTQDQQGVQMNEVVNAGGGQWGCTRVLGVVATVNEHLGHDR